MDRFSIEQEPDAGNEVSLDLFFRSGILTVQALSTSKRWNASNAVVIDLPAADARRLRDWLRERYPETEDK